MRWSRSLEHVIVQRLAEQVEDAAEALVAHGHRDRVTGIAHLHAAHEAVGPVHGDAAHDVVAEVLGNLDGTVRDRRVQDPRPRGR